MNIDRMEFIAWMERIMERFDILKEYEDRLREYCEIKGIPVRDAYIEDHSAKSFKRPEWQKYLSNLRKTKNTKRGQ